MAAPPPPRPASEGTSWDEDEVERGAPAPPRGRSRPKGSRFDADMEMTELDDRERPGPTWSGRGRELSRSHLVVRSRRMTYAGRQILVAVHLIDDKPVPLLGRVYLCEYDGDGQYKIGLDLLPIPDRPEIRDWILSRA
jgi:hypothetical protein